MEPTSFTVKEEAQLKGGKPEFVKTKLTTRLTYTLDEVCIWTRQSLEGLVHVGTVQAASTQEEPCTLDSKHSQAQPQQIRQPASIVMMMHDRTNIL